MQQFFPFTQEDITKYQKLTTQQQFRKALQQKGFNIDTLIQLILQIYRYATEHEYDANKKYLLLNLIIKIIKQLTSIKTKQQFRYMIERQIQLIGRRDGNFKKIFDEFQLLDIRKLIDEKVMTYYDLFRIIFDQNTYFQMVVDDRELVHVPKEKELGSGVSVEVQNIAVFKPFLGIRQPKQQKKDVKKK